MEAVKTYAMVTGWILVLLAIVGFVWHPLWDGFLNLPLAHSVLHLILGVILLWVAYGADEDVGATVVKVLSVIYILLGVLGFVSPDVWLGEGTLMLTSLENVIHLVLGVWGAWAAWSA